MKSTLGKLITGAVLMLTVLQGMLPQIQTLVKNETEFTIFSAIILFLVTGLTAIRQLLSNKIDNKALTPLIIITVISILGGASDLFNVIPMSESFAQWARLIITFSIMTLNLASRTLYPSALAIKIDENKEKIEELNNLKKTI